MTSFSDTPTELVQQYDIYLDLRSSWASFGQLPPYPAVKNNVLPQLDFFHGTASVRRQRASPERREGVRASDALGRVPQGAEMVVYHDIIRQYLGMGQNWVPQSLDGEY